VAITRRNLRSSSSDGVHGTPDGYAERAAQVARIAERCNPAPEPAP